MLSRWEPLVHFEVGIPSCLEQPRGLKGRASSGPGRRALQICGQFPLGKIQRNGIYGTPYRIQLRSAEDLPVALRHWQKQKIFVLTVTRTYWGKLRCYLTGRFSGLSGLRCTQAAIIPLVDSRETVLVSNFNNTERTPTYALMLDHNLSNFTRTPFGVSCVEWRWPTQCVPKNYPDRVLCTFLFFSEFPADLASHSLRAVFIIVETRHCLDSSPSYFLCFAPRNLSGTELPQIRIMFLEKDQQYTY